MSKSISRRSVTAALAAIPAAVAIGATVQAIEPDPIYAAIEAHRAVRAQWDDAMAQSARGLDDETMYAFCDLVCDASWAMLEIEAATTVAGVAAFLAYVDDYSRKGHGWPCRARRENEGSSLGNVPFELDTIAFAARSLERIAMGGGNG